MRTIPSGDDSTTSLGTLVSAVAPRLSSMNDTPSERVTVNGPAGAVGGKLSPAAMKLSRNAFRCAVVALVGSEPIRSRQQDAAGTNSVYHSNPRAVTSAVQLSRVVTLPVQATCHQSRVCGVPPGMSTAVRFSATPVASVAPVLLLMTVNAVGLPNVTVV